MDDSINLRTTIAQRVYQKGQKARAADRPRDSHEMNPGSDMIAVFHAGYDGAAMPERLAADQVGVTAP